MVLTIYRNVIYLSAESDYFQEDLPMRGEDTQQNAMFSYLSPEQRVPQDHPLRKLRPLADQALKKLSRRFAGMYARVGRPSIPPEKLLRALLLQVLYTVRSERLLMEQLDYNLLFRWFVGLNMDDAVWDATVYSKNRERWLEGDVAEAFFKEVLGIAKEQDLLSDEHFTVDGTLIEAWAGQKSFKKKDAEEASAPPDDPGNPTVSFHGEKRSNQTHQSTTDPEARLYKKSKGSEAKLAYLGHVLMENRNGLVVEPRLTLASGRAEREAALEMIQARSGPVRITVGGDKNYDTEDWVRQVRACGATPHVAQNNTHRSSAVDVRTTRHAGYAISQKKRKRVEEIFGWMKTVALMRKVRHRGRKRVAWMFTWAAAAYNLVRIRNLMAVTA
jgi:transposase